ncbi:Maltose/maltodextrin ABC transporter, permease protein MalG [Ruminococcaceae bacterium BL-6]|nr:Maltose/maltodextrin ABC transporter, permease protein MalG [Ruminococcaceae bacterium BL-6]
MDQSIKQPKAAGIVAALVPPIVLFLLCNRKIVEGLTAGAVKG